MAKKLSNLTKYLAIPSIATMALGGGLLCYSGNAENRYRSFIEETSRTIPAVRQVDALDNALDDLFDSEKALTEYLVHPPSVIIVGKTIIPQPAIYHSPNVDESLSELDSARNNITNGRFAENKAVETLDNKIRGVQNELSKTEKGKSEEFYAPQRMQIRGLQKIANLELSSLKKEVPASILEERKSLVNQTKGSSTASWIFGIFGFFGAISYGFIRWLDR